MGRWSSSLSEEIAEIFGEYEQAEAGWVEEYCRLRSERSVSSGPSNSRRKDADACKHCGGRVAPRVRPQGAAKKFCTKTCGLRWHMARRDRSKATRERTGKKCVFGEYRTEQERQAKARGRARRVA